MRPSDSTRELHNKGKNVYGITKPAGEPALWPSSWKTIFYKDYGRFPAISLANEVGRHPVFNLIGSRASRRNFAGEQISKSELSTLLKYSCGIVTPQTDTTSERRAYPSGGARFPIEVYMLLLKDIDQDLTRGVYHYNVRRHALEYMWDDHGAFKQMDTLVMDSWVNSATAIIVLTGVFWRTQQKYKERGYRYLCIETGHIAQNMYLASEALSLKCSSYGGTYDDRIEQLLKLEVDTESLVCSMVIGK